MLDPGPSKLVVPLTPRKEADLMGHGQHVRRIDDPRQPEALDTTNACS
jgi:hypothetical protein